MTKFNESFTVPTDFIVRHDDTYIYTRITKELRKRINECKDTEKIHIGNVKNRDEKGRLIYRIKYCNEWRKPMSCNEKIVNIEIALSKDKKDKFTRNLIVYDMDTIGHAEECKQCHGKTNENIYCKECDNYLCFVCYTQIPKKVTTYLCNGMPCDEITRECPFCKIEYNF